MAVVDKISDYLTPASVIAEPLVSIVTEIQIIRKQNVFSDALCHRRNKVSFLISR